ncbi:MAG: transposase [Nitrospira sp.]|nr:transposase [Nitrospira sp.]
MRQDTANVELKETARGRLNPWLLEKIQQWINGLLEAELTEQLGRPQYERAETATNYRNGYRPRPLNCLGLGRVHLSIPRDRAAGYRSQLLPERRGQDKEMEAASRPIDRERVADLARRAWSNIGCTSSYLVRSKNQKASSVPSDHETP